jgi:hypothetical protein
MICYTLRCSAGHEFDGWFRDGAAYDEQAARGLLSCPVCGVASVTKAIMAPAVVRGERRGELVPAAPPAAPPRQPVAMPSGQREATARMLALMRAVREHVQTHFEDVGERFPEEARKIHYGESDERGIYGAASAEEVRDLLDEGITIRPLPLVPDLDG